MNQNAVVRNELDQLLREGVLDAATHAQLTERYPVGHWDWRTLGRWFLFFGAISVVAGSVILLRDVFSLTLQNLAALLILVSAVLFVGGWTLRKRSWSWSARTSELMGGFALIGLSFVLGKLYSTGSGNWPALLLIDWIVVLLLSYALNNVLLLVLGAVVFFTWFGGETGYSSSWGAYWFGMNYPLRFLGITLVITLMGLVHLRAERGPLARFHGFSKVWISFGLFLANMALWLLAIFGNFGEIDHPDMHGGAGEIALFNALWFAFNLVLVGVGLRFSYRMVKAYGVTFFIIQIYTLFFTQLSEHLGWLASLLIAGGSALGLAFWLEVVRRKQHEAEEKRTKN